MDFSADVAVRFCCCFLKQSCMYFALGGSLKVPQFTFYLILIKIDISASSSDPVSEISKLDSWI